MEHEQLEALVREHGKAVYGFCLRLAGKEADADDLYQETFVKAVELNRELDGGRNPKAFLLSVAVGVHRNRRRKAAWRQRIAPAGEFAEEAVAARDESASPEEALLLRERQNRLLGAAERLDERLRIPLYLHYTADLSVEEIAALLRIPQGTVKSRLHKARKRIKSLLEEDPLEFERPF